MDKCQYDTGSMYGCQPACSRAAAVTFTYESACYGPFVVALCKSHVSPMAGRVYPDKYTIAEMAHRNG